MSSTETEEFQLPSAVVQRIVKAALPDNIQIAKDAKVAISTAGKIFINYLTACANDLCMNSNRSTISGTDVLEAMEDLEFPDLISPLKEFFKVVKIEQTSKQSEKKEKKDLYDESGNDKEIEQEQYESGEKDLPKEKKKEKAVNKKRKRTDSKIKNKEEAK